MKILVDTNIIISAAINPLGLPSSLVNFLISFYGSNFFICEQTIEELHRFAKKKSSTKYSYSNILFHEVEQSAHILKIPQQEYELEYLIRDIKDRPILRAAIANDIDIIISGDKDFLESGITKPIIITAKELFDNFDKYKATSK